MTNNINLNKKTILVMGAAGQIGQAIVKAALLAGANVVALDQDTNQLEQIQTEHEERLYRVVVDMTDRASISRALDMAHDKLGNIDGAVNSAYPRNKNYGRSLFEVEYEDFCQNLSSHLGGYFLFMQMCASYAILHGRPFALVNLSSIYGSMAPRFEIYEGTAMTMPVEYAGIKAGLEHITRYVNAYMKGRNGLFRANCISPGGIMTGQDPCFVKNYERHCLRKGLLVGDDVVGSVIFLLSEASRYIAGQNIIVDDGFSI